MQRDLSKSDTEKKPFAKDDAELRANIGRQSLKWETMTRLAEKLEKKDKGDEDFKDKTDESNWKLKPVKTCLKYLTIGTPASKSASAATM